MSVITTLTCTPNRIEATLATLSSLPGRKMSREDLVSFLSPSVLQAGDSEGGTTIAEGVLGEMVKIGLVSLADGKYHLNDHASTKAPEDLRFWLRRHLTSPTLAADLGQASMPLAVSWFLMQDQPTAATTSRSRADQDVSARLQRTLGDHASDLELTNEDRYRNFLYWARYLGFAWSWTPGFVPDPTVAIRSVIDASDLRGQSLSAHKFVASLAEQLPVLEGGQAWKTLVQWMVSDHRPPTPEETLSQSTSLAIRALEVAGDVVLEALSDAPSLGLHLGESTRRFTHVRVSE